MAEDYIDREPITAPITADNFVFDTISSNRYPVSKMLFGAVGTATYVSAADPLPVTISGVATAALQTTGNGILTTIDADTGNIATSVASIDTKTPALGQALAAASVPVVLTAAQLSTLTPPAAITGFALESGGNLAAIATDAAAIETLLTTIESNQLEDGHNVTIDNASIAVTGTFWQATQPVSLASAVAVTDNSGSLTVDAPVGTPVFVRLSDGSSAISTLPVSVSGVSTLAEQQSQTTHLATIAGDTTAIETAVQLLDDAVVAVDASGTSAKVLMQGAIRDDALSTLTPVDGDAVNLRTDANGALWATISGTVTVGSHAVTNAGTFAVQVDGAALTALQLIDDAIHSGFKTNSLVKYVVVGAEESGDTGNVMALQVSTNGGLFVDYAGSSPFQVQGTQLHGAAFSTAQAVGIVGIASATAPSDVDGGDAVVPWHLLNGSQVCNLAVGGTLVTGSAGLPVAQQGTWNVGTVTTVTTCSTVTTLANGQTAHDSAVTGSPLRIGAKAETALSGVTLVADGDATDLHAGVDGVLITRNHTGLEDIVVGNASNTDGSSTEVIAAAGAGIKQYLTSVTLTNMSATGIYVEMKSGTTVRWRFPLPAEGGVTHSFDPPLPPNAANEAWNFDPSAAATTVYCSAQGFKSKV